MTLSALKEAIAHLLETTTASFVSNNVDLLLIAINNAKNYAQQRYDFERARTSVSLVVNATTGGLLSNAVEIGTNRILTVKKIEAAFLSYQGTINRPVRLVSKKGQVEDAKRRYEGLPYAPSVASPLSAGQGGMATELPWLVQQNQTLFLYPNSSGLFPTGSATVYMDVVEWLPDYVDVGNVTVSGTTAADGTYNYYGGTILGKNWWINHADHVLWYNPSAGAWWITATADLVNTSATNRWALTSTSTSPAGTYTPAGAFTDSPVVAVASNAPTDFFLEFGAEFLFWRAVIEGNHLFSQFVPRQEGELPPPDKQAERAWQSLIDWDSGLIATNTSEMDLM